MGIGMFGHKGNHGLKGQKGEPGTVKDPEEFKQRNDSVIGAHGNKGEKGDQASTCITNNSFSFYHAFIYHPSIGRSRHSRR